MPKKYANILEFQHKGFLFYFTKESYADHCLRHPELRPPTWETMVPRIKRAVLNPDFVFPSYDPQGRFCCYIKEFETSTETRYTKVVMVQQGYASYKIITAFRPTQMKEKLYNTALEEIPWL